jgi:hypothetical protein
LTPNRSAVQRGDAKEGEEKQDGKRKPKQETEGVQKRGDSHEGNKRARTNRGEDMCPILADETKAMQVFYALAFII